MLEYSGQARPAKGVGCRVWGLVFKDLGFGVKGLLVYVETEHGLDF